MSEQDDNKALIRRVIEEALNNGKLAIADTAFTSDYVAHVPGAPPLPPGPEAFRRVARLWRSACSDWHMTIEQLVAEGDIVANRFTTRATHDGVLLGIPPTRRSFTVHGMEFHRLKGGKVAESWISDDIPGIFVQLGLVKMPTPGPGGPPPGPPR